MRFQKYEMQHALEGTCDGGLEDGQVLVKQALGWYAISKYIAFIKE